MLLAIGRTEIIFAVVGKPLDLLSKIPVAQIAFGACNLVILHGSSLVGKSSGNILLIGCKLVMYLFFPAGGNMERIIRDILKNRPVGEGRKHLGCVVGIAEGAVEWNVLFYMKIVNGVLEVSAALAILVVQTEASAHHRR